MLHLHHSPLESTIESSSHAFLRAGILLEILNPLLIDQNLLGLDRDSEVLSAEETFIKASKVFYYTTASH